LRSSEEEISVEIKQINMGVIIASTAIPLLSAALLLSSPSSMWGLINQYQLFLMLPFLNCYLAENFINFIQDLQITLIDLTEIGTYSLPLIDKWVNSLHYEHPYYEYRRNIIKSGSFSVTQLETFKVFLLIFCANMLFIIIWLMTFKWREHKLAKFIIRNGGKFFHLSVYIRGYIEIFLLSCLLAGNEIYRIESFEIHPTSYAISCIFIVSALGFIVFILAYLIKTKDVSDSNSLRELFKDFKK
jgi:hypothetical protein